MGRARTVSTDVPSKPLLVKRYRRLQEIRESEAAKFRISLAELRQELKAARAKPELPPEIQILQRENAALKRRVHLDGGKQTLITTTVKDVLSVWDGKLTLPPKVEIKRPAKGKEVVALVHVTDTQIGKVTDTYDTAIAEGRLMEFAEKVVRCVRVHHDSANVRELHVYLGGDMVEGELIFPHQGHEIDSSVLEQACVNGPRILAAMILYWTSYFDKIVVCCVRGNHGRPAGKHANSHPKTNWDTVCYLTMEQMIKSALVANGREGMVEIRLAPSWYIVDEILGHKNLLIHGDVGIKGFAGFPWYGVQKRLAGWLDAIPESFDNLWMGHYHQYVSYDWNGHFIFCGGSIESDNEFARSELGATGRPKQRLQLWTAKHGPVVDLPILLDYGYTPRLPYSRKRRQR
jgi:hypothetical protein